MCCRRRLRSYVQAVTLSNRKIHISYRAPGHNNATHNTAIPATPPPNSSTDTICLLWCIEAAQLADKNNSKQLLITAFLVDLRMVAPGVYWKNGKGEKRHIVPSSVRPPPYPNRKGTNWGYHASPGGGSPLACWSIKFYAFFARRRAQYPTK